MFFCHYYLDCFHNYFTKKCINRSLKNSYSCSIILVVNMPCLKRRHLLFAELELFLGTRCLSLKMKFSSLEARRSSIKMRCSSLVPCEQRQKLLFSLARNVSRETTLVTQVEILSLSDKLWTLSLEETKAPFTPKLSHV